MGVSHERGTHVHSAAPTNILSLYFIDAPPLRPGFHSTRVDATHSVDYSGFGPLSFWGYRDQMFILHMAFTYTVVHSVGMHPATPRRVVVWQQRRAVEGAGVGRRLL